MTNQKPKIIAVDFDGVIADYSKGYQGKGVFGKPLANTKTLLHRLHQENWKIIIYTTRTEYKELAKYLKKNNIPFDYINNSPWQPTINKTGKIRADVYLDDRAITFDGNQKPDALFNKIVNFVPWQKT